MLDLGRVLALRRFIEVAAKIRDNGRIDYECAVEGEVTERLTAVLPGADAVDLKRCRFLQVRRGVCLYVCCGFSGIKLACNCCTMPAGGCQRN